MDNKDNSVMNSVMNEVKNENLEAAAGSEPSYEFVTETIKKRPINKRKIINKTVSTIFLAILFGIISSLTFAITKPIVDKRFNPDKDETPTKTVTLAEATDEDVEATKETVSDKAEPVENANDKLTTQEESINDNEGQLQEQDEAKKEVVLSDGESEAAGQDLDGSVDDLSEETDQLSVDLGQDDENSSDENTANMTEEERIASVVLEQVKNSDLELKISDYTSMYKEIGEVANQVKKSIAIVSGLSSEMDWFRNLYEGNKSTTGLIVAENGKELLILARTSVLSSADFLQITFCNGEKCKGTLKKSDANTDLSIVAVNLDDISNSTMEEIEAATFGSSVVNSLSGKPIIAIGDPFGVSDSIAIGQITSSESIKYMPDSNASILTTDIYGSTQASGVIADFEGRVIGILCQDGASVDTKNLIRAYGISDLKSRIEKISNGQELAYLGIKGIDVTEEATEEYGVPEGAFIVEVVPDSPAMVEGIRMGDIIVKMGTTDVSSLADFKEVMLKSQPGDQLMVTVLRKARESYLECSYEIQLGRLGE